MEIVHWFVDFFLHLDQHLAVVIQQYGVHTYTLLFLIVFLETGLVVTPLLRLTYAIVAYLGPRVFHFPRSRFFNPDHLKRTHDFYENYGGKTIIVARFVPIIRTFAPFVAGIGAMSYGRFLAYNVAGGLLWVSVCVFAGYFFGNLPLVRKNFSLVILAIVVISLLPAVVEYLRHRLEARRQAPLHPRGPGASA